MLRRHAFGAAYGDLSRSVVVAVLLALAALPAWVAAAPLAQAQAQAQADEDEDATSSASSPDYPTNSKAALSLQVENDLFGDGSDRHYTNGLRISYMFPADRSPKFANKLRDVLPWLTGGGDLGVVMAWGQNIFTPSDISIPQLTPDDRPYAGWLYTELGLSVRRDGRRDVFLVSLGVIGPASQAERTQKRYHRLINSPRPEGWDNQLRNEPAVVLIYESQWLSQRLLSLGDYEVDLSPRVGLALGNVYTYASVGAMARFGPHLPNDFGPPRIRPSLPGSPEFSVRKGRLDWYLFGGFEARAVARNIFLDGNSFRDSHSVEKRTTVWDLQAGGAMTLGFLNIPARLTYNFVYRRREFIGQQVPDKFGSISLSFIY